VKAMKGEDFSNSRFAIDQTPTRIALRERDCVFTLPCRGRVAHRRCAEWGARRCRESQRAYARFHPNPPRFARRPSPSRGRWFAPRA
jgi:hypothetical protein